MNSIKNIFSSKKVRLISVILLVVVSAFVMINVSYALKNDVGIETTIIQDDKVLAKGNFRDQDRFHKGSGTFEIIEKTNGSKILKLDNFSVSNGPDLFVWASAAKNPSSSRDVRKAKYYSVGKLKKSKGNQVYELPNDFNPDNYESVVIWCRVFGFLFSAADYK